MQQQSLRNAAALGVALFLVPAPALAAAPPPTIACGSVITTSTYLTNDLSCTNQGITLRGDVTLDLRGHQLTGTSGTGVTVVNADGFRAAEVKNGSVKGWSTGLALHADLLHHDLDEFSLLAVTVSRLKFSDNTSGIDASNDGNSGLDFQMLVRDSSFQHNSTGIGGLYMAPVTVTSSRFLNNGSGVGIDDGSLDMYGSYLRDNKQGVGCPGWCRLSRNELVHNGTAVSASYFRATLISNVFTDNDTGFAAFAGGDNAVSGNVFDTNKTAVDLLHSSATLTSNRFIRNATGVTTVDLPDQPPLTLKRNLLLSNGNAIHLPEGGTLQANSAFNNKGWGIFAPGATDLGGNKAHGNLQLPECVGVVCRP